jgi:hypothetical protein
MRASSRSRIGERNALLMASPRFLSSRTLDTNGTRNGAPLQDGTKASRLPQGGLFYYLTAQWALLGNVNIKIS